MGRSVVSLVAGIALVSTGGIHAQASWWKAPVEVEHSKESVSGHYGDVPQLLVHAKTGVAHLIWKQPGSGQIGVVRLLWHARFQPGLGWGPRVRIMQPGLRGPWPDSIHAALDSKDGTVHLAYTGDIGYGESLFVTSLPRGVGTWKQPQKISLGISNIKSFAIAVDSVAHVPYVMWGENGELYAAYDDGDGWHANREILPTLTPSLESIALTVDPTTSAVLASWRGWSGHYGEYFSWSVFTSVFEDGVWSPVEHHAGGSDFRDQIVHYRNVGNRATSSAIFAWQQREGRNDFCFYWRTYSFLDRAWSPTHRLEVGDWSNYAVLANEATGGFLGVWFGRNEGDVHNNLETRVLDAAGTSWSDPVRVTPDAGEVRTQSCAIHESTGVPLLLWNEAREGEGFPTHGFWSVADAAATAWSSAREVAPGDSNRRELYFSTSVGLFSQGRGIRAVAAWLEKAEPPLPIYFHDLWSSELRLAPLDERRL